MIIYEDRKVKIEADYLANRIVITITITNSVSLSAKYFRELSGYRIGIRSEEDFEGNQKTIITKSFTETEKLFSQSFWMTLKKLMKNRIPPLYKVIGELKALNGKGDPMLIKPEEYRDPITAICNEVLKEVIAK